MDCRLLSVGSVLLVAFLLTAGVTALLPLAGPLEAAQANGTILYADDDTCPEVGSGTQGDPYCRIQDAVDAAEAGGELRVAAGVYTGTQLVLDARTGYTYTQVVFVDRDLTLRGGYAAADWGADPDPIANPTVIDAQRQGRGISIVGVWGDMPSVTVDGFTITGGDYTGLGNADDDYDVGGGLYAYYSALTLRNSIVADNTAGPNPESRGGGIYFSRNAAPGVRIDNTTIISNSTRGSSISGGGGLYGYNVSEPITITNSTFQDNHADYSGGGAHLESIRAPITIIQSDFTNNTAQAQVAGGLWVQLGSDGEVWMDRVRFQGNQADNTAAALRLYSYGNRTPPCQAHLTNVLFSGNTLTSADEEDAVLAVGYSAYDASLDVTLAHVTAAGNQAPTFLYAEQRSLGDWMNVTLTNTLLVSFTHAFAALDTGITEVEIRHTNTLTDDVTTLHQTVSGEPSFQAINPLAGDSKLDATHHLLPGSAAIDAGVDTGVMNDIDGDFRPQGSAPDIGADEYKYPIALPGELTISGPTEIPAQVEEEFAAGITPITATAPFTYVWEATDQLSVTHASKGSHDVTTFRWETPGDKTITATATNVAGTITDTHTVHVVAVPVLDIGKTGPAEALVGAPITYTLTITNEGTAAADSLSVTDTLPVGAHYVTGGTQVGDLVSWQVPSLDPGMTTDVQFVVTATQPITNAHYLVSASGGYTATGALPVVTVVGVPALSISKEGPYSAKRGEPVSYDLTVVNDGTVAATNLVISDALPAGATYLSGGTLAGDEVQWTIPSLAGNGGAIQVTFIVTADQTITNSDYVVSADGGFTAVGDEPVITIISPPGPRYVATGGADGVNPCIASETPCATLQHAVNVANAGEEVRVAAGIYTGSQMVTDSRTGYTYTQVVFVDKSLTLRGGYSAADWGADPNPGATPEANPTVIDAQRQGRGVSIVGVWNDSPSVTVDGFTITGGDYTGLGNADDDYDVGGGLYAYYGALTLRNSIVADNTAGPNPESRGGGVYLYRNAAPGVRIENSTILSNSVHGGSIHGGGGLYGEDISEPIIITNTTFQDNHADYSGGGAQLWSIRGSISIIQSNFTNNTAEAQVAGGLWVQLGSDGEVWMDRVRFQGNRAHNAAAAMRLYSYGNNTTPGQAHLTNVLFSGNTLTSADEEDAVLAVGYSAYDAGLDVTLAHVTAADNQAPTFLYAEQRSSGDWMNVTLTNTLLASFTYGFAALEVGGTDVEIRHTNTLTDDVSTLHQTVDGEPNFEAINALSGEAWLDSSGHLRPRSDAIDAGVDAGVTVDIDGDMRPIHDGFDIGADEFTAYIVYLPRVSRDAP
jgi:uncharacterized repeat protein (TIGR01451 family)